MMPYKPVNERLKERYDLNGLCRVAGYLPVSELEDKRSERQIRPKDEKELIFRVSCGILAEDPFSFERVFLRVLPPEGIEIFYFKERHSWYQEKQTSREGLVYFCLPNIERLQHEQDFTQAVTKRPPDEPPVPPENKKNIFCLNVDRMFPDKWSHMALEILLRQVERGSK